MQVYLVRHGRTAWNAERRNQGHTDIPLDADGLEQAQMLAVAFEDRPIPRIFTSDLQRARMTAEPVAKHHNLEIEIRLDLRERCFGEWEGLPMERVASNFIELGLKGNIPREEVRPPGGESTVDVWSRLESVAKLIEQIYEPTLIVCHGGSGAILLARLLKATPYTSPAFRMDNTGVTTLARRPDYGFHMMGYNDSSHLIQHAAAEKAKR